MGKYFGTDGFRGEANNTLTARHAFLVGRFLGWYYGKKHEDGKAKIVIGKDTRLSGYMLEYSLVAGLTSSGANAYLMHVTTTPSVSYTVRKDGFDCGIMISASHNPFTDNGIKVINGEGHKLEAEVEDMIETYIDTYLNVLAGGSTITEETLLEIDVCSAFVDKDGEFTDLPLADKEAIGRTVDYVAGRDAYIEYLISKGVMLSGLKIGLDLANGASFYIAPKVYGPLGADLTVINDAPNGTNINNGCGSTHIEGLQKLVKENKLAVGFAYDGDADRCLAVDENGEVVTGDVILYICGKFLKERGLLKNDTVVTTVMSNIGLYKAFDRAGIKYEQTAVGDKYVYANMQANGHCLGGEDSGHIIFSEHAVTGDGILTSLMLCQVMAETGKSLAELRKDLKIYPQLLVNVRVDDKELALNEPSVQQAGKEVEAALADTGRLLLRCSGTEPLVRVMVEAQDDETCEEMVYKVVDAIKASGHAVS